MGLDETKILEAMLISGSLLSTCPSESLEAGGTAKPYMFGGWPAGTGIYAAICASQGMTGTRTILEGKMGLLNTWAHQFDLQPLSESLGKNWALEKPRRKAHACCGYTHPQLDAMLSIIHQYGLRHMDISRVDVKVFPQAMPLLGSSMPSNALASKFSSKYLLAVVLMKGRNIQPEDTEEDQFRRYLREGASSLIERTHMQPDPSLTRYSDSIVTVQTRSGQEYTEHLQYAKGAPENPLAEAEILEKFRSQVSIAFTEREIEHILTVIFRLRESSDFSELISVLTAGENRKP